MVAVVAEVVGDLLCSAVAPFREMVAAVGALVNILHSFQGVLGVVGDLNYLVEEEEEEVVVVELQY